MVGQESGSSRRVNIKTVSDELSSSSSESSSEDENNERFNDPTVDLPADYWQIQKLVKYLKVGPLFCDNVCLARMRNVVHNYPIVLFK